MIVGFRENGSGRAADLRKREAEIDDINEDDGEEDDVGEEESKDADVDAEYVQGRGEQAPRDLVRKPKHNWSEKAAPGEAADKLVIEPDSAVFEAASSSAKSFENKGLQSASGSSAELESRIPLKNQPPDPIRPVSSQMRSLELDHERGVQAASSLLRDSAEFLRGEQPAANSLAMAALQLAEEMNREGGMQTSMSRIIRFTPDGSIEIHIENRRESSSPSFSSAGARTYTSPRGVASPRAFSSGAWAPLALHSETSESHGLTEKSSDEALSLRPRASRRRRSIEELELAVDEPLRIIREQDRRREDIMSKIRARLAARGAARSDSHEVVADEGSAETTAADSEPSQEGETSQEDETSQECETSQDGETSQESETSEDSAKVVEVDNIAVKTHEADTNSSMAVMNFAEWLARADEVDSNGRDVISDNVDKAGSKEVPRGDVALSASHEDTSAAEASEVETLRAQVERLRSKLRTRASDLQSRPFRGGETVEELLSDAQRFGLHSLRRSRSRRRASA